MIHEDGVLRRRTDPTVNAATLRRSNMLQLLTHLRANPTMSRTELAVSVGLSVQTVHRLIDSLTSLGFVTPVIVSEQAPKRGRPSTRFRFCGSRALVVGIDVGSETTRIALASLTGTIEHTAQFPTSKLHDDLVSGLTSAIRGLLSENSDDRPLVAVGIGVPSVVDSGGTLVRPWLAHKWRGIPLRAQLEAALRCPVTVAQDNHLSSLAESSKVGSAPNANVLVVLELGIGIGAGMIVNDQLVPGSRGQFGRLMRWPCHAPTGMSSIGNTLGELLVADGLMRQYTLRGGTERIRAGADLFTAAMNEDTPALEVLDWAASQLDETLQRIALLIDPDVIVVGGGIGRGLQAAPCTSARLQDPDRPYAVRMSVLGVDSVVIGGVLAAQTHIDQWLLASIPFS